MAIRAPDGANKPPILAQKQQKMPIFYNTDFWGLKYPLEVRVQHKTCSTICKTTVPAILNHKNSTRLAGEAKNSQNWVFLKVQIKPILAVFGPISSSSFFIITILITGSTKVVQKNNGSIWQASEF